MYKNIRTLVVTFVVAVLSSATCDARAVRALPMKELIQQSALVFAGKVKSVKPSEITTELTYPTWNGAVFEWLKVEVEVIEPIKGTKKSETIRILMLSSRGDAPLINAPGMVNPRIGASYLLCLLPTKFEGVYASITAPFDDDQGIFLLDRESWTDGATYYKDGKEVAFREQDDKNAALWNLVDGKCVINPSGAESIRRKYRAEIASPAPKDAVIYLKWKKEESGGWQWNAPDEGAGTKKAKRRTGPASKS